jgi:cyanophycinase
VALAVGEEARIAVVPTASGEPLESGERYVKLFGEMGAASADWLRVEHHPDANADAALKLLVGATGIFITGGDQARLVELLAGTRVMESIRERNADGVVVRAPARGPRSSPATPLSGAAASPPRTTRRPARGWSSCPPASASSRTS